MTLNIDVKYFLEIFAITSAEQNIMPAGGPRHWQEAYTH